MTLTKEEKQLKEAMKIILRDGNAGRLFEAAKARYQTLKTDARLNNMAHEIDGVDWAERIKKDVAEIESMYSPQR